MANQFTLKNGGYEPFIGNFGLVPQPPIPEPDAEDNGKVLGVSNGSYALVNGGGGGGEVVIVPVVVEPGTTAFVAQIESKVLFDLFISGATVLFENSAGIGHTYTAVVGTNYDEEYHEYTFTTTTEQGATVFFGESDTANPRWEENPQPDVG